MLVNEELFLERYNKLNDQQRKAVNQIYGPVMVIAGPGTGKTEVLSMRIANLLRSEAQVQPQEILCLTYTDEATNSMRRRLVQIIGAAAHKVNIGTFHSFCNNVIQNNSEYFSLRALQPITDLERTEFLYEMLEELPQGHIMRKLSGNIYFDAGRLARLFDMMKRENLSAENISDAIDIYLNDLPAREEYIYKKSGKGYAKGDLKQSLIDEETKRMETTRAAAQLFEVYREKMKARGRYDFNDMIMWVLEAFKNHPALLLSYQERHQFILVDEFQDTNGSQNELLNLLTEFWDDPNIFVVGDDDQSIYEFQGARIRNIIDFYDRYKQNIHVVVLPQNYRSSQLILDKATAAIENNTQRLISQLDELQLDKNIVASHPRFAEGKETVPPVIKVYNNILQEEADIISEVESLQKNGVPLNHVAILYAQHKQADNIIALMERKSIPYNVKKPVNILELPLIEQILKVLYYLDEERKQPFSSEARLFEIMHAPYYEIAPTDIAMLSLYIQQNRSKDRALGYWRLVLANVLLLESLHLGSVKAMSRMGRNLDNWLQEQLSLPLPLLVEKIIYESGIVAHLLKKKDHVWQMQVLNSFFEFVKEVHGRKPGIKIEELLRMIERMQDENIAIPVQKVVHNENGVYLYTAHGAKGNEFEYVYLIGATKNFWEDKRGGNMNYKLPDTITNTKDDAEKSYRTEVARRLFYVALTRAKKHLQVSYTLNDNNGKPIEHSIFIDEISTPEERIDQSVTTAEVLEYMQWALQPIPEVRIALANHQWIEQVLQSFTMSYTALSKYLRCHLAFYYEHILKVPFLRSDALAFGSAVHNTLERMFLMMKEANGVFPPLEEVLNIFGASMYREQECFTPLQYNRRMEQGRQILSEYYNEYIDKFEKNVEIELKIPRYHLDGVPVTGKIDKIELDGDNCTVIDYKSGDPDKSGSKNTAGPTEADPNGGDYWRQMVFYKLLIENYQDRHWRVVKGMFDFIERGKKTNQFKRYTIPFFEADEQIVRKQLRDSYAGIMNHEFDKGCGREDCNWCNFAKRYELIRDTQEVEIDDL
ncbi:MAG: ATP-dependent helicase [Bacteroidetes bacterium]|nr:ATP-dependent helicase [Bacteroidota bacterium]